MTRIFSLLLFAGVLACSSDDNEFKATDTSLAVKKAALLCSTTQTEMAWMFQLIESSKDDPTLHGPIYAFHSHGQTVFVHQPWIMSCLACILYDCEGNRLDNQEVDMDVLMAGFQDLTEIYIPKLE
ncbi:MAG TPA: hypothetical protein VKZ86_16205 [Cyclobacteriaceae bacterium]|nr:hypothetical protein [Cyclobacteriaceae bacterium]